MKNKIEKDVSKSLINVNEEDYQKLHLVLLFFMTINKENIRNKKYIYKQKKAKKQSVMMYKKFQKFFMEKMIVNSRRESILSASISEQEIEEAKSIPSINFEYSKVVQSAYHNKNVNLLKYDKSESNYNVSKELAKSAAEIKRGIHQESHKHNKMFLSLTRKLIKENSKNKSKSFQMKKQKKLEKNLQFMKDRQELKILENSWKTHTKYQKHCKHFNLGEILKVTETKSRTKSQSDFILQAQ
jgi:hypothetical protein